MDRYRETAKATAALIADTEVRAAWMAHTAAEAEVLSRLLTQQSEIANAIHALRNDVTIAIDSQIRDGLTGIELRLDAAIDDRLVMRTMLGTIVETLAIQAQAEAAHAATTSPPAHTEPQGATGADAEASE